MNAPATGGDLARMIGSDAVDKNSYEATPSPPLSALKIVEATNIISVWDPHKMSVIAENSAPLKETAVVFHDSFGLAWQPFLGYAFKKIIFMSENREFNSRVITEAKPTVVINEILERYFYTLDPDELLAKSGLP